MTKRRLLGIFEQNSRPINRGRSPVRVMLAHPNLHGNVGSFYRMDRILWNEEHKESGTRLVFAKNSTVIKQDIGMMVGIPFETAVFAYHDFSRVSHWSECLNFCDYNISRIRQYYEREQSEMSDRDLRKLLCRIDPHPGRF